jgi:outer membrane protein OmpA-like peptidoglycan-associated protein
MRILPKITFAPTSILPAPESQAIIDETIAVLLDNPHLHVAVEGHRDGAEPDPNGTLGRRRAEVVFDMLVQGGVAPGRLCTIDHGDIRPIAPNDTAENRARNRRVEFRLLERDETCP